MGNKRKEKSAICLKEWGGLGELLSIATENLQG
jgi:hypothetical protein